MKRVIVVGSFDDIRSRHIRFLEEAARLGSVEVRLLSDAAIEAVRGKLPKFPEAERCYFLEAVRFVQRVTLEPTGDGWKRRLGGTADVWAVDEADDTPENRQAAECAGLEYHVVPIETLHPFPPAEPAISPESLDRKRVIVTGCYDWFHSGHVRFFEECSALGDLYVVVGSDANVRLLKGEGHPMFSEDERRYLVGSIRYVTQALVATGSGWLDAEPEIERLRPHVYAVNEDGDRPEKRAYCEAHGIEYRVLKRLPKEGLPRRQSTSLRGF